MPVGLEKRVLRLIGELIGLTDHEEFCHGLLRALRAEVPADFAALNELPPDLPHTISITDPSMPRAGHEQFARLSHQNPIAEHFRRGGDGRATRFSDVIGRRELHQLELYREVYRPLGVEFQIAFTLPAKDGRLLGAVLSRRSRDFSARERDLLNLARPYLIELYRNALSRSELSGRKPLSDLALRELGLTGRQAEVLRLTAGGRTAQQVAAQIGVAPRTVQKHLENCYRALGVTTSAEAIRVAGWAGPQSW